MAIPSDYSKARRHLTRCDPVLKSIIKKIGPCTLQPNPDRFGILVRAIVSQQISGKAAESILARLAKTMGPAGFQPRRILRMSETKLRTCGLSANKTRFLRDLAEKVHSGATPLDQIHVLDDEAVVDALIPILGIGRWTAQMFLIFSLGRLDVLPVDDLGVRVAVRQHFGFRELPKRAEIEQVAEAWRPYRTVATWYMWRSLGDVPQSDISAKKAVKPKQKPRR